MRFVLAYARFVNRQFSKWRIRECALPYLRRWATYPHIAIGLVAFAALPLNTHTASAAESAAELLKYGQRPAGLYRLKVDRDHTICRPLLYSLNQPFKLVHFDVTTNPSFMSEILLSSNLDVPWQRKFIKDGQIVSTLDFAKVDLANDGHLGDLYRWGYLASNRGADDLIFTRQQDKVSSSRDQLDATIIKAISGIHNENVIVIDPQTAPDLFLIARAAVGDSLLINVARIRTTAIVLAVPAAEANQPDGKEPLFQVYALRYHRNKHLSLVCQFSTTPQLH